MRPPEERTGSSHAFPTKGPDARGCELSRMRTAATMSLSATGSRNAPNGVINPCSRQAPQPLVQPALVGTCAVYQCDQWERTRDPEREQAHQPACEIAVQEISQGGRDKDAAAPLRSKACLAVPHCRISATPQQGRATAMPPHEHERDTGKGRRWPITAHLPW